MARLKGDVVHTIQPANVYFDSNMVQLKGESTLARQQITELFQFL